MNIINKKFSLEFNTGLTRKFHKKPSAQFVANHFNLLYPNQHTITKETARKWMQGMTLPDADKLQILVKWLNLDITSIFNIDKTITQSQTTFENDFYTMIDQAIQEVSVFSQKTMLKTLIKMMQENPDNPDKKTINNSDIENIYSKINSIELFNNKIFDCFNNKETIYKLLILFVQDITDIHNNINKELFNRDFIAVEFMLGRLLGSTGMIGADRLNMVTHLFRSLILQMEYDKKSHHQFETILKDTIYHINQLISKR